MMQNNMRTAEEKRNYSYKKGLAKPMSENKECPAYLGVHVGEQYASKLFENVTIMPYRKSGYDFTCGKGLKVDVKSSCLINDVRSRRNSSFWSFNIGQNMIADYFLCLGFDTREDLKLNRLWLINNTMNIWTKQILHIHNSSKGLKNYKQYEYTDRIEELKFLR